MTKKKSFLQPPDRSDSPPGSEWQRLSFGWQEKRAQTITEHPIWSEITSETVCRAHKYLTADAHSSRWQSRSDHQDAHMVERCLQVILPPMHREEIWTNVGNVATCRDCPSKSGGKGWANRLTESACRDPITFSNIFSFIFLNYSFHSTLGIKHKR